MIKMVPHLQILVQLAQCLLDGVQQLRSNPSLLPHQGVCGAGVHAHTQLREGRLRKGREQGDTQVIRSSKLDDHLILSHTRTHPLLCKVDPLEDSTRRSTSDVTHTCRRV